MATENPTTTPQDSLCAELLRAQASLAADLADAKAHIIFMLLAVSAVEILAIVGILLRAMS